MQKRKQIGLVVCVALMILMSQALWGQIVVKVNGTDGSGVTDTLTLANHALATSGFDSLSPSLREYEIPYHAQGLDFRVVSNFPQDVIGLGAYTSIHHLSLPTQTDTWKLQFNVDSGRTSFLIQWPAGLGLVGGGYWKLIPDPNDAITFPDVDMTSSTSLSISPIGDTDPHTFFIVTGDKQAYRSFTANEIATAADSKGAVGKAEKRKPYASEGTFVFTNSTAPPSTKTDLHIEWGQTIDNASLSITPTDSAHSWADAPKNTKLDIYFFTGSSIGDGQSVTIFAKGNKGKQLVGKKYWWTVGGVVTPTKTTFSNNLPQGGGVLRLKMPNINNIGEEIYTQNIFAQPNGLTVGDPVNPSGKNVKLKDIFRAVIHPKWKDVLKTLSDKTGQQTGPADCLLNFVGAPPKPIEKVQKALPPAKHNNVLLGQAVALRVNIGAGDGLKIEEGGTTFGSLKYVRQSGDPAGVPAGVSVRAIADSADLVLRCKTTAWGGSYAEWAVMLGRINGSFSGAFDTASFGQAQMPTKPAGGTIAKGTKAIATVPYLYRTSFAIDLPSYTPPNIALLEARNQPDQYKLMQNYPNPFNPMTNIEFAIPEEGFVTMRVYNILGQVVATLVDHEFMDQGTNEVTFDATGLASGVYYYQMLVNDGQFQQVKKMMLVK